MSSHSKAPREMLPVELIVAYAQECALVITADGVQLVPPPLPSARVPRRVLEGDRGESDV